MKIIRAKDFTAGKAWGAANIAAIPDASVRLHWTDQPYPWHVNDGEEVFTVLDGVVDMHYRVTAGGDERIVVLETGDIFFAGLGDAHSARPRGQARVLVVEQRSDTRPYATTRNHAPERRDD
jgi:mannose-6-phosphate isomerase-like protein (cupin superfamily)